VLPIGFVQSSLLASLVLMKSDVSGATERAIANGVVITVYLDDFIGSHDDMATLTHAHTGIREACVAAGLLPNPTKLVPPSIAITAFNCDPTHGSAIVRADRVAKYMASPNRTVLSDAAFEQYRDLVARKNNFLRTGDSRSGPADEAMLDPLVR
jgi:hypothetical protein